jgi:hypothetical protein
MNSGPATRAPHELHRDTPLRVELKLHKQLRRTRRDPASANGKTRHTSSTRSFGARGQTRRDETRREENKTKPLSEEEDTDLSDDAITELGTLSISELRKRYGGMSERLLHRPRARRLPEP